MLLGAPYSAENTVDGLMDKVILSQHIRARIKQQASEQWFMSEFQGVNVMKYKQG